MNEPRVALLAQASPSTRIVYNALARRFNVVGVVLEDAVSRRQLLLRRARKLGLSKVGGQLAFRSLIVPLLKRASAPRIRRICDAHGLDVSAVPERLVQRVGSINSEAAVDALVALRPQVVVVNGTRIIGQRTLTSVPAPFINTHTGITPLYRGVHGGYWALVAKDLAHCGVTVHLVDTGIDTGAILAQARIEPTAEDTFVTYPYLQYAAALPLLLDAVCAVAAGAFTPKAPPAGPSRLWSHPTFAEYVLNRLRHSTR